MKGTTRNTDPFSFGLSAIQVVEFDPAYLKKLRNKNTGRKVSEKYKNLIAANEARGKTLAKHIYYNGEVSKQNVNRVIGERVGKKILNAMTYSNYLFGDYIWVVYESDDGRSIGLVNKYGQTPQEVRNG